MKTTSFVAESTAEALAQIRAQLGPQAVVVDVRRLSGTGFSRLWQKSRIQVLAGVPQKPAPEDQPLDALLQKITELNQQLPPMAEPDRTAAASLRVKLSEGGTGLFSSLAAERGGVQPAACQSAATTLPDDPSVAAIPLTPALPPRVGERGNRRPVWNKIERALPNGARTMSLPLAPNQGDVRGEKAQTVAALESLGLLPSHALRIAERVRMLRDDATPVSLEQNLSTAKGILNQLWRQPPWKHAPGTPQTHVFIGAPGSGKTTSLCKWLAQVVLLGDRSAQVWRLDGRTANTAEALSVYAEILGVPVLRSWSPEQGRGEGEMLFIDLPGVAWQNSAAVTELGQRLREFEGAHVHLVLNAAYEVSLLLDQVQAFSALPIADLICTHLDEEHRRGKLWNLALGTNCALSFLTAGQNIPGHFRKASADQLWPDAFAAKDESGRDNAPAQPRWQSIC